MIKLGKVAGPYMVDMTCLNHKLLKRAQAILKKIYNMDGEEAIQKLQESNMHLGEVIRKINKPW